MVRCDNCAIEVEDGVKYCPLCGKNLAEINPLPVSDEDRCNALLNISVEHRLSKEWDEAVSFAVKALKCNPQSAKAASTLALIYEERGLFDEASVWYKTVLEIEPDNQEASSSLYRVKKRIAGRNGAKQKNPIISFLEDHKLLIIALLTAIVIITMILSLVTGRKKSQQPIVVTPLPQQSSSDSMQQQPTPFATIPGDNQTTTTQEPQLLQQPVQQAPMLSSHTTI